MPVEDLRQSPMMNHLLDALDRGEDIGHYGRLTFAMVAHHFLENDELVEWLSKDGDADEQQARALAQQVEERGYNPPRRGASSSGRSSRISRSAQTPTTRTPATSTTSCSSPKGSTKVSRSTRKKVKLPTHRFRALSSSWWCTSKGMGSTEYGLMKV